MSVLLTDAEIKQAIAEADREIWSYKAHPKWEGEKYLMKAQLKKAITDIEHNTKGYEDRTVGIFLNSTYWHEFKKEAL